MTGEVDGDVGRLGADRSIVGGHRPRRVDQYDARLLGLNQTGTVCRAVVDRDLAAAMLPRFQALVKGTLVPVCQC